MKAPKYVLDLSAKVARLRSAIALEQTTDFSISIRREHLYADSRVQIENAGAWDLRQRLRIEFVNEVGKDYGGMSREWFSILSQELAKPSLRLFAQSDSYRLMLNPGADVDAMHFVGLVCGLAIYHGMIVQLPFAPIVYKCMLGLLDLSTDDERGSPRSPQVVATLDEMRQIDAEFTNGLEWILKNDVTPLELTMVSQDRGIPLKEGGENIPVTEENKREYVDLVLYNRLVDGVRPQLAALVEGFLELVPASCLQGIEWSELETLLCGSQKLDIDEWRAHTVYTGLFDQHSELVATLWHLIADMTQHDRALLLRFVTGTDRLPVGGFAALQGTTGPQKFTVTSLDQRWEGLPTAHTCFNRLELPMYPDVRMLEPALFTAIRECVGRFDME